MSRSCGKTEPHLGHTWGDDSYGDMGTMWEECLGVDWPPDFFRPAIHPVHRLTDTNGEELIELALRERRNA